MNWPEKEPFVDRAGGASASQEPLFIILSANYTTNRLASVYGNLPPCMLPHGGQRLYEAQCDLASKLNARTILILPNCYELLPFDVMRLAARGTITVSVERDSEPCKQLEAAIRSVNRPHAPLYLLFGNTVVDCSEGHPVNGFARIPSTDRAGFFYFSDPHGFEDSFIKASNFGDLISRYVESHNIEYLPIKCIRYFDDAMLHPQDSVRPFVTRSGNKIASNGVTVIKSGDNIAKISGEAEWFRVAPSNLHRHFPRLSWVNSDIGSYELELLDLPLLSDLYSLSELSFPTWLCILRRCLDFIESMHWVSKPTSSDRQFANFFDAMVVNKTFTRLRQLSHRTGIDLTRNWNIDGRERGSLYDLAHDMISRIERTKEHDVTFCHGDLHFGNIFYDDINCIVRVIDPRGIMPDESPLHFGDARYDLAKICHSVIGLYDNILSGRFELDWNGSYDATLRLWPTPLQSQTIAWYQTEYVAGRKCVDHQILAMTSLLFLSMADIHEDNLRKQVAILVNAFRIANLAETFQ